MGSWAGLFVYSSRTGVRSARSWGSSLRKLLSGAGAALVVKAITGFAVAALAATAAEATITDSLNPNDWGQQVRHQVAVCKAELETGLETGQRGIGACVSAFAKQHGKLVSAEHRASGARVNHGNGNANGHNNVKGSDHGNGNGKSHGQPSHKPDHTVAVTSAEN
jgi:hypothetical protein